VRRTLAVAAFVVAALGLLAGVPHPTAGQPHRTPAVAVDFPYPDLVTLTTAQDRLGQVPQGSVYVQLDDPARGSTGWYHEDDPTVPLDGTVVTVGPDARHPCATSREGRRICWRTFQVLPARDGGSTIRITAQYAGRHCVLERALDAPPATTTVVCDGVRVR
jgi:hypothetical protein